MLYVRPETLLQLSIVAVISLCIINSPIYAEPIGFGEGRITVDNAGMVDKKIKITIMTDSGTEDVEFTTTRDDIANPRAKADRIAREINTQATLVRAGVIPGSATVQVAPGPMGTLTQLLVDTSGSGERDRVNPRELRTVNLLFEIPQLVGSSTGDFEAFIDIGGPGGDIFRILNTNGMNIFSILNEFKSDINSEGNFMANIIGSGLFISGVTEENDIEVFFGDPGFRYQYGVAVVPEPNALLLLGTGLISLLGCGRRYLGARMVSEKRPFSCLNSFPRTSLCGKVASVSARAMAGGGRSSPRHSNTALRTRITGG